MASSEMQTLILWALLAKGGAGFQKDVRPEVKKPEREALVEGGPDRLRETRPVGATGSKSPTRAGPGPPTISTPSCRNAPLPAARSFAPG